MGERTSHPPGTFSWVDLSTSDPAGAKGFYGELFGWEFDDQPVGDGIVYTMCRLDGGEVCALSEQQDQERSMGIPPHWNNYVTVDDVDARTAQASGLGGTVMAEPFDVLEAGRMSVVADPAAAVFSMWQPRNSIGATVVNVPGALTWNELATRDTEGAKRFYRGLFGWRLQDMDTGGGPAYAIIYNGERSNGGIREQSEAEAGIPPHWLPYFAVETADAAVARAGELGGTVLMQPTTVPAGRFAAIADPQGAVFAVFEGEFDD
jgi:predicted enzyme related to lactoylglutathione lyase